LNENILYLWRDDFFDYRTYADQTENNPNRSTALIWNAFDARKHAFELSPVLLNLISHDEIFPTDDQWSLVYAYAINAAMDGVPMMFYGQENGAQNNAAEYGARTDFADGISPNNNFARYETNFGKSIPHFKRYNHMTNIWNAGWSADIRATYGRLNQARENSPALRSQQNYFIPDAATTNWNPDIFAVAKFQQPGVSAATQDVVFAFINNDFRANYARAASFKLDAATDSGANWFGIQPAHVYNVVDLAATNPTTLLWEAPGQTGSTLIANGIYVGFQSNATWSGGQAQFLRLLDVTAGMTPTNVNDLFANADRFAAPVLTGLSNRTVVADGTLAFAVNFTQDAGDAVELSCASTLAPGTWSFTAPNSFSFSPTTNELGVHSFLFTATGIDGFDEELITVTVLPQQTTPYEDWAGTYAVSGFDPDGPNGGLSDNFDGDEYTNEEEYWADTDPTDPNSFLQLQSLTIAGSTANLVLDKDSAAPRAYVVHTASQLVGNRWDWTVLGTNSSTNGVLPIGNATNSMLLFRISIPAQ
ncbi:MAG: hypothetical protein AB7V22_11245, partial [Kiritimatiellia bacterium]